MAVDAPETRQSAPLVAQVERRQRRRVKVCLEFRMRPADLNNGSFEEVVSTLNASRDGFYFLTPHDRYCKGMRLCITPAFASATAACEKPGEVVRVKRHSSSFGVAVVFSNHATLPSRYVQSAKRGNKEERRRGQRQPFSATTKIIDGRSGARVLVRTADLSMGGCYVDTLNPLPLDTPVRLHIEKERAVFEFHAKVISCHPGSGMGLVFERITPAQRSMLTKWLCKQSAGHEGDSFVSPHIQVTTQHSDDLIQIAHGGGKIPGSGTGPVTYAAAPSTANDGGNAIEAVLSSENLLNAVEGMLQQKAEKIVASALSSYLTPEINRISTVVSDLGRSCVRSMEEHCTQVRETFVASLQHDFLGHMQTDLARARGQLQEELQKQVETSLATARETIQQLEKSTATLPSSLAEARDILQLVRSGLQGFSAEVREIANNATSEFRDETLRISGNQLETLNQDMQKIAEAAIARSVQVKIDQFRQRLESILSSSLVTAVAAANERSRMLLDSLLKGTTEESGKLLFADHTPEKGPDT
jgi:hypothetical protein